MSPVHYGVHGAMASQGKITSVSIWRCARWCQTVRSFGNRQKRNKKKKKVACLENQSRTLHQWFTKLLFIFTTRSSERDFLKVCVKGSINLTAKNRWDKKAVVDCGRSIVYHLVDCVHVNSLIYFSNHIHHVNALNALNSIFLLYLFFCMRCTAQHPEQPKGERKNKSRNKFACKNLYLLQMLIRETQTLDTIEKL